MNQTPNAPGAATPAALPDFGDLLADAMATRSAAQAAKSAKERMSKGGGFAGYTAEQLAEDAKRIADWEAKHEWTEVANVAAFTESHCLRCGDYSYLFTGLMRRRTHRHQKGAMSWVKVKEQRADLPNEISLDEIEVPFCAECCDQVGFQWDRCFNIKGDRRDAEAQAQSEAKSADELLDGFEAETSEGEPNAE